MFFIEAYAACRAGGGGGYSFVACLSHLAIDYAFLSRWSTVPTAGQGGGWSEWVSRGSARCILILLKYCASKCSIFIAGVYVEVGVVLCFSLDNACPFRRGWVVLAKERADSWFSRTFPRGIALAKARVDRLSLHASARRCYRSMTLVTTTTRRGDPSL